jgi:hypothetical protein
MAEPTGRADVLVVSLGTTAGWRSADAELVAALRRAGAGTELVTAQAPREVRTFALTDVAQARAARRAALEGIRRHRPRSIVYCSSTASLLWPRPGAIRFDAPAAENRPGRHGVWQRPVERRRFAAASLLLPFAESSLAAAPPSPAPAVVLPSPIVASGTGDGERDIAAIAYAPDPVKKGLGRVLEAWRSAGRPGETLIVAGNRDPIAEEGVEAVGMLPPDEYRALLRRARVFVIAPRREDFGQAQLEALADGCVLVTTPGEGPYPALALARQLDERLTEENLATSIRLALDDPRPDYAARATELLAPYRPEALDALVAQQVLPALLAERA